MSLPRLIGFLIVGAGLIAVGIYGLLTRHDFGWWISLVTIMLGCSIIISIPGFADD